MICPKPRHVLMKEGGPREKQKSHTKQKEKVTRSREQSGDPQTLPRTHQKSSIPEDRTVLREFHKKE